MNLLNLTLIQLLMKIILKKEINVMKILHHLLLTLKIKKLENMSLVTH